MCIDAYVTIRSYVLSVSVILKLEKVSVGHGCPRLLFLFHLQLNIGYTISEQDTIYILQTEFIATLFL